jgi:Family of unknown function (DUF6445)
MICLLDDFAADALAVRQRVIAGGFKTETGPDGALYSGISQYEVPHWHELIAEFAGGPIVPRLSCFRLNLAGEFPNTFVHSDDICAQYASIVYLNRPEDCRGGTAFWKHKALQVDRLPPAETLVSGGMNPEAFYALMEREWQVKDAWEQVAVAEMRFNRFIAYPTSFFHSRWPFEAFGTTPEDGRLIWVCFFDTVKDKR